MTESDIMLRWAETRDDLERDAPSMAEQEEVVLGIPRVSQTGRRNMLPFLMSVRLALFEKHEGMFYREVCKDFLFHFARDIPLKVWRVSVLHEHDIQRGHGWGRAWAARPPFDILPTFVVEQPWRPHNMAESEEN